jgi:hypothetical protein
MTNADEVRMHDYQLSDDDLESILGSNEVLGQLVLVTQGICTELIMGKFPGWLTDWECRLASTISRLVELRLQGVHE